MKDILIIIMSAILGYIVLSAFAVNAPDGAVNKFLPQPQINPRQQEIHATEVENKYQTDIAKIKSAEEIEKIRQETERHRIEAEKASKQAQINAGVTKAQGQNETELQKKESDNTMLVIFALLIFILIYVYLRYQKHLAQVELEKEREYQNMIAKKEYAEHILAIVANGNVSIETEHKLLKILDELNKPQLQPIAPNVIGHPNPDIEQLEFRRTL